MCQSTPKLGQDIRKNIRNTNDCLNYAGAIRAAEALGMKGGGEVTEEDLARIRQAVRAVRVGNVVCNGEVLCGRLSVPLLTSHLGPTLVMGVHVSLYRDFCVYVDLCSLDWSPEKPRIVANLLYMLAFCVRALNCIAALGLL